MGAPLRCCAQTSHCSALSCCGTQAPGLAGFSSCNTQARSCGSWAPELGLGTQGARLSCSVECAIFSDQESNPCLLHWQADSYPLYHQGSSRTSVFNKYLDDGDDSRTTLQTTGMWYLPLNKFLMSVFSNLFVFILWMRELELKVVK